MTWAMPGLASLSVHVRDKAVGAQVNREHGAHAEVEVTARGQSDVPRVCAHSRRVVQRIGRVRIAAFGLAHPMAQRARVLNKLLSSSTALRSPS